MRTLVLLTSALFLAGCAANYQASKGRAFGFVETQLSENVWRVAFKGNAYTPGERAEDFALIRSADLTLLNGFTHFALTHTQVRTEVSTHTTPMVATTSTGRSGKPITTYSGGDTYYMSRPTANNTVVMFKGKPEANALAFDARFICDSVGRKYEVICDALKPVKKP